MVKRLDRNGGYTILTVCIFLGKCFANGNVVIRITAHLAQQYSSDIKTLPNFIIAFMFTMWFFMMKEHHSKIINQLAKSVFTVYIVHQVPAFISFIWKKIFIADRWISDHAFGYVFIVYMALLVFGSIIDFLRKRTIEPIAEKTTIYKKIVSIINRVYNFNMIKEEK